MSLFYEDLLHEDLVDWAGEGNVERADVRTVSRWHLPEQDKTILVSVGVPIVDHVLISHVCFQPEAEPTLRTGDGKLLYLLAEQRSPLREGTMTSSFGAEPGTGVVYYVMPDGDTWFANSSITLWVQCLHHYGLRVDTCDLLLDPDWHEEEAVLAELNKLAAELEEFDPAAFEGYRGFIWAEFLSRWLW
ncbi:SUKH-4 family immunity protein [Streptomyces sp. NPDC001970]